MIQAAAQLGLDALSFFRTVVHGIPILFMSVAVMMSLFTRGDGVTTTRTGDCSVPKVTQASIHEVVTRFRREDTLEHRCIGHFLPGHWTAGSNGALDCHGTGARENEWGRTGEIDAPGFFQTGPRMKVCRFSRPVQVAVRRD